MKELSKIQNIFITFKSIIITTITLVEICIRFVVSFSVDACLMKERDKKSEIEGRSMPI